MDEWLTSKEAMGEFKISRQTLYRWIKDGKVIAKKFGGALRIDKASLNGILAQKEKVKQISAKKIGGSLFIVKTASEILSEQQKKPVVHQNISHAMQVFKYKNSKLVPSDYSFKNMDVSAERTSALFASIGFHEKVLCVQDDMGRYICEVFGRDNEEFFALLWLSETPIGVTIKNLMEYISFLSFIHPVLDVQRKHKN